MTDRRGKAATIAGVVLISFFLNHAPFLWSTEPRSLGADGDSWFHVAIQMFLMDPRTFAADPEVPDFYVRSRPPLELTIHRAVIALSRGVFGGDLLVANMAGFWMINLVFLSGCFALSRRVLQSTIGGGAFAAASAGLSLSLYAWWGMPFGAVIPHDFGLGLVPWLLLAYLRWDDHPRWGVAVFAAIGLVANLYPLQPVFLALALLGTTLSVRGLRVGPLVVRGGAFVIGALPAITTAGLVTLRQLGSVSASASPTATSLLEQYYGHLLPASPMVFVHQFVDSPVWFFAAIAGATVALARRQLSTDERRLMWFAVWIAVLSAAGLTIGIVSRPMLAFLFHRASALLYIPAYLGTIAAALHFARRPSVAPRLAAIPLVVLVALNAGWRTPLAARIRDVWPLQASAPYYELATWARESTPPGSLFLAPYGGRTTYFAFRVYSQRPVMLHYALGEMVLVSPRLGARFAAMEHDIAPLFQHASSTGDFLRVASKYRIRFIITDDLTPQRPNLPVVFRNAVFTVFDVGIGSSEPLQWSTSSPRGCVNCDRLETVARRK